MGEYYALQCLNLELIPPIALFKMSNLTVVNLVIVAKVILIKSLILRRRAMLSEMMKIYKRKE